MELETFIHRLKRIGIEIELVGNYPWIYLDRVNGIKVKEKLHSEHGFTLAFLNKDDSYKLTDTKKILEVIRGICQKTA
jgi:hypothetical protein